MLHYTVAENNDLDIFQTMQLSERIECLRETTERFISNFKPPSLRAYQGNLLYDSKMSWTASSVNGICNSFRVCTREFLVTISNGS